MATCRRCTKKLGLMERRKGICSKCAAEERAEADASRSRYQLLLGQLVEGTRTPEDLAGELSTVAKSTRLPHGELIRLGGAPFRSYAERALSDDLLNTAEEELLVRVSEAVGLTSDDLNTHFRDILHRLVVARVNDGRLPTVDSPRLMSKKGEIVHIEMTAALMKEVKIREYQAGHSGFSFRIVKGVNYRVGQTRGRSVVVGTQLQVDDTGVLSISSKRSVFLGSKSTIEMPHARLVDLQVFSDGVQFHLSNRKSAPLFRVESGDVAAAVINAAAQRL